MNLSGVGGLVVLLPMERVVLGLGLVGALRR